MSARLNEAILDARSAPTAWDVSRSDRVLLGVRRTVEVREGRRRAARRGLAVAAGAALLVVGFLRAASPASPRLGTALGAGVSSEAPVEPIAARALDDGGSRAD